MVTMIKPKDRQTLAKLIEEYSFAEVKEAIKMIKQTNPDNWMYTWSESSLKRHGFWILATIQKRYTYRQMINVIEDIERNR